MMKKTISVFLVGLLLVTPMLHAGENTAFNLSFWQSMRSKIELLAPQKRVQVTNATGGVRGASVSSDDLYWKGEATIQTIASDELDAFAEAMKLAEVNDAKGAVEAFSAFLKKFPESTLRKDAEQALTVLKP